MPENSYIAEVKNLHYTFGNKIIFDDINLKLATGKITVVMGPSGTGKTTLLKLLAGQLQPVSGEVWFNNKDVNKLSRKNLFLERTKMGMLFQSGALFTDLSVFENVAMPLREHTNLKDSMINDIVLMKLEAVGLRGAKDLMPSQLSGGMSRRVALARAIALDPSLIMYDEPFAGQDPITMGVLVQLIKLLNDCLGLTTVLVSHDVNEALSIADYAYIIGHGKIIAEGDVKTIRKSEDIWVRQFINGLPDGPVSFHYPSQNISSDLMLGNIC